MLGIIGAMEEEVARLKECMSDAVVLKHANMEFNRGTIFDKEVVVVRSGIGKVNAGICAQVLVDVFGVDAIINTGIAGSLNADINIGDIVISSDTVQHDMNAVAFGYPLGQIPRMDTLAFPADEKLIELAKSCCERVNDDIEVFVGRVASGDQFVADKGTKEQIVSNFGGYCTEMEGAAIGQAAYLNNVPYVVIRAISDKADDSASVDYPTFEAKAIEHSVRLMKELIKNY
ncbi:MAG: 5'-methylthioadenosine/adenosylhomocysteine nucleosidase [Lachnospiraceae bacterium]|nr:5'-methylthioadenosine/adenosylhomocysteine nucleosidase [Lachnospiraceae bacterium]